MQITVLEFKLEATSFLQFGRQPGGQLRGALYGALRNHACPVRSASDITPDHTAVCPVCALLSPRDEGGARGYTPPPPFTIKPPPGDERTYQPGDHLEFGFVLFGDQRHLYPFVVHGMRLAGQSGVGHGRGTFRLCELEAVNPLTGQREELLVNHKQVRHPTLHVTENAVNSAANMLDDRQATLIFHTPTRLIAQGKILRRPAFDVLVARLLERLDLLREQYLPQSSPTPYAELNELARDISLAADGTRWIEIRSGSRRQGRTTPISGFVGKATYTGPLGPFLPWLLWGQFVQVGKNTTKGNGWYSLEKAI
ncbi:MAG: CRISPR system precrRNA processing endoribonuclease RAMP protein Cas6 [Anaerolineae bacterium]|nr:CRISPR system precrRNA processing endoribonuclease RAMP protein Cas6 [Anaerolineae bacterium]